MHITYLYFAHEQSQHFPDLWFAHKQSEDCAVNPWFVVKTMDPRFAQLDNPWIAKIHASRITDISTYYFEGRVFSGKLIYVLSHVDIKTILGA